MNNNNNNNNDSGRIEAEQIPFRKDKTHGSHQSQIFGPCEQALLVVLNWGWGTKNVSPSGLDSFWEPPGSALFSVPPNFIFKDALPFPLYLFPSEVEWGEYPLLGV